MSLAQQLEQLTTKLRAMVPAERLAVVDQTIAELVGKGVAGQALKAGNTITSFGLPDGDGMLWRSDDLLRNGPLVIVFYRGRWCALTWLSSSWPGLSRCPTQPHLTGQAGPLSIAATAIKAVSNSGLLQGFSQCPMLWPV